MIDRLSANQTLQGNLSGGPALPGAIPLATLAPYFATSAGTLWLYKAKTGATSGYPGDGYMLWDNATQVSAGHLIFAHLTTDDLDIDLLLAQIATGNTLLVQDANVSGNFQKWTVSGSPVNTNAGTATSYWTVPVTLVSSGGTGASGFANNHQLAVIRIYTSLPPSGAAGGILTGTYPNPTGLNIDGQTAKTTPVDADELALADSAASFATKKLTWANLKATLKAYFDTLYTAIGAVTSVGATAPIQSSGGATPTISITAASSAASGSLSANDYSALQALQHAALGGI